MRRLLGRLVLLGAAAGAAYALRGYLKGSAGPDEGDVRIVLEGGATIEPGSVEAREEFADIARKILDTVG